MSKTKYAGEKMLIHSMSETGKPYKTPEQLSADITTKVRQEKEATKDLRASLTQKVAYEMPRATREAIDGVVNRMVLNKLHEAELEEDPELTLKPNMAKTLKVVKEKVRFHNGKYEVNKFDPKGKMAWSCCQSKHEDADGCQVKTVDKKRWCVTTYNE
jgi:hypothetical protein